MDNIITLNIPLSLLFSLLGTVFSIISLVISVLTYRRDSISVKVKISNGFPVYGSHLGKIHIFLEAINTGRRVVQRTAAGFDLSNKEQLAVIHPSPIPLPYALEEGKSYQLHLEKEELLNDISERKVKIKKGWFRDATGRVYKTKYKLK